MERVYNAIVLVDEPGDSSKHYATMVEQKIKTIETRMKYMVPEGDIIICCGNSSMTKNKGLALCIVHAGKPRPMTTDDEKSACIECIPGRVASDLSNWRFFSKKFKFSKNKMAGTFQAIFLVRIPNDVKIL